MEAGPQGTRGVPGWLHKGEQCSPPPASLCTLNAVTSSLSHCTCLPQHPRGTCLCHGTPAGSWADGGGKGDVRKLLWSPSGAAGRGFKKKTPQPSLLQLSPARYIRAVACARQAQKGQKQKRGNEHVEVSVAQSQHLHPGTQAAPRAEQHQHHHCCALASPPSQAGAAGLGRGCPAACRARDKELPEAPDALTRALLCAQPQAAPGTAAPWSRAGSGAECLPSLLRGDAS